MGDNDRVNGCANTSNQLAVRKLTRSTAKFKRTCKYIFNGPLATKAVKVQYIMLWAGEEGRDIRDGWALSEANSKILASHWTGFENNAKPKFSFRVSRFQLRAIKQVQTKQQMCL